MKIIIGILANAFAILLTHVKSQNNEVCFDAPAFISSIIETGDCYCAGGCDWFAEPLGDDDYEYYDDIYEGETRCSVFGECCIADDGSGMTANDACCVCSGGFTGGQPVPSIGPTITPKPTEAQCYDVPGWFSADSPEWSVSKYDCEWYGDNVYDDDYYIENEIDNRCEEYGDDAPNFGYTANQACCVCGGGFYHPLTPSFSPSLSTLPTVSSPPSDTPSVNDYCVNVLGWTLNDGTRCSWYNQDVRLDSYYSEGDTRCGLFGSDLGTDGKTAAEACCVCGGGVRSAPPQVAPSTIPTPFPSARLSFEPSLLPSMSPTKVPTVAMSPVPTFEPSLLSSMNPTKVSTVAKSPVPTFGPSLLPSINPNKMPVITDSSDEGSAPVDTPVQSNTSSSFEGRHTYFFVVLYGLSFLIN